MIGLYPIGSTSIPYNPQILITGSAEALFEADDSVYSGIVGIQPAGELVFELFDEVVPAILGIAAKGSAIDITLYDDYTPVTLGVTLQGSLDIELYSETYQIILGATGSALIEIDSDSNLIVTGTTGSGEALFEITPDYVFVFNGVGISSEDLVELDFVGSAYSTIVIAPPNNISSDILELPYVAYCMNTKTKGVTAYTANVNDKVPCLVATPVDQYETEEKKNVADLYMHIRSTGDVKISLMTNETLSRKEIAYLYYNDDDGLRRRRVKLPKGIQGTNWQFFVENDSGSDLEVHTIEPQPSKLQRKI